MQQSIDWQSVWRRVERKLLRLPDTDAKDAELARLRAEAKLETARLHRATERLAEELDRIDLIAENKKDSTE